MHSEFIASTIMWPILEIAVESKSAADREKLDLALRELTAQDPTFRAYVDKESGQTVVCGVGEGHLDRKIDAIRRTYGVEALIGQPQVAYRETIGRGVQITYTHKRQTGGSGEFAEVTILFEPAKPNSGYRFSSWIDPAILPAALVAGVEKGLEEARDLGLLAGFPVIDFEAALVDAKYHDIDSTPLAFEIAARGAFRKLREEACPLLLEPVMKVEVATPEDFVGDVIGDLNRRRGMISGTDQRGTAQVIIAEVPLSNMFGYENALKRMTDGRAEFTMVYNHYERVPRVPPPDDDDPRFPPAAAMRA
jgi:elongation factor G